MRIIRWKRGISSAGKLTKPALRRLRELQNVKRVDTVNPLVQQSSELLID